MLTNGKTENAVRLGKFEDESVGVLRQFVLLDQRQSLVLLRLEETGSLSDGLGNRLRFVVCRPRG